MHPVCDKSACRRRQTPKTWRENQLSCRVDRALHGQCVVRSSALDAPAALPSHGDGPRNASRLECTGARAAARLGQDAHRQPWVAPHRPAGSRVAPIPPAASHRTGPARRATTSPPTSKLAAPARRRSNPESAGLPHLQKRQWIGSSCDFSLEYLWSSHLPLTLQRRKAPCGCRRLCEDRCKT